MPNIILCFTYIQKLDMVKYWLKFVKYEFAVMQKVYIYGKLSPSSFLSTIETQSVLLLMSLYSAFLDRPV